MSLLRGTPSFSGDLLNLDLPLTAAPSDRGKLLASLVAGQLVSLNGVVYTGRDQTHRLLCALIDEGKELPVDLDGQLLYYVGPSPARPGRVIGAAGPTTSYRMDAYTPKLLTLGLSLTMGKGVRSSQVRQSMLAHGAVYLAAIGGAGAYLSRCVKNAELIAFPEAGPEAMFRLEIENFPAVVINDLAGNDYYEMVARDQGRAV